MIGQRDYFGFGFTTLKKKKHNNNCSIFVFIYYNNYSFRIDEKGRKHRAIRGRDIVIPVPAGTTLSTDDGRIIGELEEIGSKIVVAKGGRGGSAGTVNWCGEKGERNIVRLEMRLHSDIALVGYVTKCHSSRT